MIHVDHGATDRAVQAMERSYRLAKAIGDTANMSVDAIAIGDVLLAAGQVSAAQARFASAHDLVGTSNVAHEIHRDNELARHYDVSRVALARHDAAAARAEAAAYLRGATEAKNDARIRQAHELNGLVALEARQYKDALAEMALADQENPAVWYAMARAYAGLGDAAKANTLLAQAAHINILPTLPSVITRAAIAAATRSATSGTAHGTPR